MHIQREATSKQRKVIVSYFIHYTSYLSFQNNTKLSPQDENSIISTEDETSDLADQFRILRLCNPGPDRPLEDVISINPLVWSSTMAALVCQ